MDYAYDAPEIHRHGEQSGHVPIIDVNPRRDKALKELKEMEPKARAAVNIPDPKAIRYRNRSNIQFFRGGRDSLRKTGVSGNYCPYCKITGDYGDRHGICHVECGTGKANSSA